MRAAALGLLLLSLAVSASACIMCNKKVFPFEHLHEKPSHILNFCEPGYYDAKTGLGLPFFCQPCGKGYYCDNGSTQTPCPDGTTTETDTASSADQCIPPINPAPPTSPAPPAGSPSPPNQVVPPPGPPSPTPDKPDVPQEPSPSPVPVTGCEPCAESNPDVLLTTGRMAEPPNGLWRVRNWSPRMNLMPEFLCSVQGVESMIGDVAIRENGDVILVDILCNLWGISSATYQQLTPTLDKNTSCPATWLTKLAVPDGTGCTGLTPGLKSNELMLSTNGGAVLMMQLVWGAGWGITSKILKTVTVAADPVADAMGSQGGTDVTMGPDGSLYRFIAQDNKASYTATRFSLDSSGQLDGNYTYTERLLDNQDSQFANAGSFCTKDLVVGVAARGQRPPAGVEAAGPELVVPAGSAVYASFFSYGLGQSERRQDDGNLPKMPMVGQTASTGWTSGMRVNGAAVRPRCGL